MHFIAVTATRRPSLRNHLTYAKHPEPTGKPSTPRTGKSAPGKLGNPHTWRPHRFGDLKLLEPKTTDASGHSWLSHAPGTRSCPGLSRTGSGDRPPDLPVVGIDRGHRTSHMVVRPHSDPRTPHRAGRTLGAADSAREEGRWPVPGQACPVMQDPRLCSWPSG